VLVVVGDLLEDGGCRGHLDLLVVREGKGCREELAALGNRENLEGLDGNTLKMT